MAKLIYAVSFFVFACSSGSHNPVTHGGEDYETVVIGKQTWLKRNLNYVPTDTGVATNSRCYEDKSDNCDKYGRLYDWATAMALPDNCNKASCASQIKPPHKGICPAGWHIPTNADWEKLFRYADGSSGTDSPYKSGIAGKYLKAADGWNDYNGVSGNGEDKFGFSALPSGTSYLEDGNFYNAGNSGYWWSASEINSINAFRRGMYYDSDSTSYYSYGKTLLLSVRCVRN
ncbi:MAG: hypothetical protein LBC64_02440 [Fibromonadaceae bacterium]|jgi:uncharacterized protein (TIGR02145 family)|nr:hypothetical protein [Fibromonadaceae bacterium]